MTKSEKLLLKSQEHPRGFIYVKYDNLGKEIPNIAVEILKRRGYIQFNRTSPKGYVYIPTYEGYLKIKRLINELQTSNN